MKILRVLVEEVLGDSSVAELVCEDGVRLHLPSKFGVEVGHMLEIGHRSPGVDPDPSEAWWSNPDVLLNGTKFMHEGLAYVSHGGLMFRSGTLQNIQQHRTEKMRTFIKIVRSCAPQNAKKQ